MKNRPVFTLNPQGEQADFQLSSRLCRDRGKKAEKPCWILICQSRNTNVFHCIIAVHIFFDLLSKVTSNKTLNQFYFSRLMRRLITIFKIDITIETPVRIQSGRGFL
jgi:hypothetical protein